MAKKPDILPFEGSITWSSNRVWVLSVRSWRGGPPDEAPAPQAVFDAQLFAGWLTLAGLEGVQVRLRDYVCVVATSAGMFTTREQHKLLTVLKAHYSHVRGRPINWVKSR